LNEDKDNVRELLVMRDKRNNV